MKANGEKRDKAFPIGSTGIVYNIGDWDREEGKGIEIRKSDGSEWGFYVDELEIIE